jgi:capsular exopolysaccharide synthesis family protein
MDLSPSRSVTTPAPEDVYLKPEYPATDDTFGLREMLRTLRRRRRVVIGACAIATLLGILYALLREPVYEATAVLMMRPNEPQVATSEGQRPQQPDNGYVQSQVEVLRSPALARQLVDRLQLADDPYWGAGRGDASRTAAVRKVSSAITATRRDGTYVVEVRARSNDPEQAARMANDLVNVYFLSREQARADYATQTSTWLSERLTELRNEVQRKEDEVEQYRAEHGLLTIDGTLLAEQQLRDAETSVVAARADMAERLARNRQLRAAVNGGRSAETISGALSSETMTQLRARQADVTRRLAEYNERYGELHPSVRSAQAEQADIERQIQAEVSRLAENLGDEEQIASARVATLQGHLSSIRRQLMGNNAETVRLRELERNAQAARAVYENFLLRYHEVSDGVAGLGGDAQIITAAVPPTDPVSRSPMLIIVLASGLGLAAGALAAFLMEQFTTTLQSADEVERRLGVPMLTSVPQLPSSSLHQLSSTERHPAGYLVAKPMSAFAESMRMLRARITHAGASERVKVVAVTSALAAEGKSSIALSLARVTALSGRKVILVDCDVRRRSLNHMLCIEPTVGIAQVLRGETSWREATGSDEFSGAHILPAAVEEFTAEDLFDSGAMRDLMRELSGAYDLVLLDCAPVLTLAEVRDLAAMADGVVLVARRNSTEVAALQTAVHELKAVNAQILGVAFNGVDMHAPGRLSYADPLYFSHAERRKYIG